MDVLASSMVLTQQTGRDLQKTILEKFSENSASWALAQSLTNLLRTRYSGILKRLDYPTISEISLSVRISISYGISRKITRERPPSRKPDILAASRELIAQGQTSKYGSILCCGLDIVESIFERVLGPRIEEVD